MTDAQSTIARLRELRAQATPTPWFQWPYMSGSKVCAAAPVEGDEPLTIADCDMDERMDGAVSSANAALIAALPALLECAEALELAAARLAHASFVCSNLDDADLFQEARDKARAALEALAGSAGR